MQRTIEAPDVGGDGTALRAAAGHETNGPVDPIPTVLVVDDRRENLLALEALIEPLGVRVVRATSGHEAVARCGEQEFAVVVLDVMMPGADGVETARLLKARGSTRLTPIIFLTAAAADRRRIHDGYASGAVDYLFKPVDPDVLRAKVAAFVELYRHRRAEHWQQRRRYADQAAAATAAAQLEGDQRFRLLADSVPTMVWTAGAGGRIDSLNSFGVRYLGEAQRTHDDVRWMDYVHPGDLEATRRAWNDAVDRGATFEREARIWSATHGGYRRHIVRAVPRHDAGGGVAGWIGVNADVEDSKRAEEEAHELELTAERQARIASDDARADLARALDRIARLQALTAALSEAVTPEEVARAVVVSGVPALGAAAALIASLDRTDGDPAPCLRLLAATGYPESLLDRWRVIPLDSDLPLVRALREGRTMFVGDAEARVREYPVLMGVPPVHAAAYALPLIAHGEPIGVMGFSFSAAPQLTEDDRTLADAIARQCAQALQRAQLFATERRAHEEAELARRRVEFLANAGAVLNESLEYQQTLQALVDLAIPFLGDYAIVDMVAQDGTLQRLALAHRDPRLRERLAASVPHVHVRPDPAHPTHGALLDGRARLYRSVAEDDLRRLALSPEHLEVIREMGVRSLLVIPLRARDRTLGVLVLGRVQGEVHSTADLQLAEELGRRAAIAIDTALLYEQAQEANRAKASFLAAISHDLRQPLNASLGFLEIALLGLRGDVTPALRADLERIQRNQQHLLALINDVLSFARVEAGQLIVRRELVPLREVFEGLPALVSPQAGSKGVRLEVPHCDATICILGDRDRVVQVFTNLLTNAIKATPAGGCVSIACEQAGDVVITRVIDTGVGIAPELLDRIFEPFVQVARTFNHPEDGIGLGLSISRNLTRAMGGELTVQSAVGSGSIFTVRLPSASAEPRQQAVHTM